MFQFTREFIINDDLGKLKAKTGKFSLEGSHGKWAVDNSKTTMYIDNLVSLYGKHVTQAFKNPSVPATKEVVTAYAVDATGAGKVVAGDVVRLVVTLGQEGRVISTYNDQYPEHKNRIFVEAIVESDNTVPVDTLVANAQKADVRLENKLAEITAADSKTAGHNTDLVITALDEFTRVLQVQLVKVGSGAPSKTMTGYGDYITLVDVARKDFVATGTGTDVELTTPGEVGQGTTNCILRNLRLQTAANIDPYGTHKDERPLPNATYTQFMVEQVVPVKHVGHQIMGSVDESLTTFVFYVEDSIATAFENALKQIGVTPAAAH